MIIPDLNFEMSLIPKRTRYLLAIDEVGRGPWAGPVTMTGCLINLDANQLQQLSSLPLRDSKKLSARQRLLLNKQLLSYSTITLSRDNKFIDEFGLAKSLSVLVEQIYSSFPKVDFLLIDGIYKINLPVAYRSVVKGDGCCFSITAASVIAKVHRDQLMTEYSKTYPRYGFEKHKGYGTAQHLLALKKFGPCPIHRLSFKPVKIVQCQIK